MLDANNIDLNIKVKFTFKVNILPFFTKALTMGGGTPEFTGIWLVNTDVEFRVLENRVVVGYFSPVYSLTISSCEEEERVSLTKHWSAHIAFQ